MSFPSESQIDELKAKHAPTPLLLLEYSDGALVTKRPPKAEYDRLQAVTNANRADAARALENFVRACVVWPAPVEVDLLFQERPALINRFGDELLDAVGASEKVSAKKL